SLHPLAPTGSPLFPYTTLFRSPVSTEAVRLRLLNASNARVYNFGFDDDREFEIVASDGGLLPQAVTAKRVQLSPGERAEIVVRRSEEHTSELQSRENLVCRLLL